LLSRLYISLFAPRHKKTDPPRPSIHLRTTAAMAMVNSPVARRRPIAPSTCSAKKSRAKRNLLIATDMAAKPTDMATLRMERPSLPEIACQHIRRRALRAKMGQMA
jgi:hypothetical protein